MSAVRSSNPLTEVSSNKFKKNLFQQEIIIEFLSFLTNKELVASKLVSKEWYEFAKLALTQYAQGKFNPKFIDTYFLSKVTIPLNLAKSFIEARYGISEEINQLEQSLEDRSLAQYLTGEFNNLEVSKIQQNNFSLEEFIELTQELEKIKTQFNSKQKTEIMYYITKLDSLLEFLTKYPYENDDNYLLNISCYNDLEFASILIDIIRLVNTQDTLRDITISSDKLNIILSYNQASRIIKLINSLYLQDYRLGDSEVNELAQTLMISGNLTYLDLSSNQITDAGAIALAKKVNNSLTSLSLSRNQITAVGAVALANALKVNNSLTSLSLCGNPITAVGATAVAAALKVNNRLTDLNLGDTQITEPGIISLANALKINNRLNCLELQWNDITEAGISALADALKLNSSLTTINLDGIEITLVGAVALAEALKVNNSLTYLKLCNTRITEAGIILLANALKINNRLRNLDLERHCNQITETGAIALAEAIKVNNSLTHLYLERTQITETGIIALAKATAFIKIHQNREIKISVDTEFKLTFNKTVNNELGKLEWMKWKERAIKTVEAILEWMKWKERDIKTVEAIVMLASIFFSTIGIYYQFSKKAPELIKKIPTPLDNKVENALPSIPVIAQAKTYAKSYIDMVLSTAKGIVSSREY